MSQQVVTLIVAALGILGTFGGVIVGQRMSQTWQREQWARDQRIAEFRVLLDAIADSFRAEMTMYAGAVLDPDRQREIITAHSEAMRVIRSRIFVIDFVLRANIENRWSGALQAHQKSLDVVPLASVFDSIRRDVAVAAGGSSLGWLKDQRG